MVLSGTRGRVFRRGRKGTGGGDLEVEIAIPTHFRCPVTLDLMRDPVTLSTGITYDRDSIEKWFEGENNTCPVTKRVLANFDVIPNHAIRKMIQDWCVEHRSYGFERIPTPRIPVSPYEVSETCSRIMSAIQIGDEKNCRELVGKIKMWGKESERNRRCIISNGAGVVLANAFDNFSSKGSIERNLLVLEEILGVLTWMRPFSEEGRFKLGSPNSLNCMLWFLNGKSLSSRQNAALVLKEIPLKALVKIEGIVEAVVNMIKEPMGNTATKACLSMIFRLASLSANNTEVIIKRFVELGLVSLLLEILVDAERGVCEKALGVLDCVCDLREGKEIAKTNALTLPLVIKKLLRVSELSSSFSVSILWKLCDKGDEDVLIEAIQVGAFQKLLVLLQVGCGENTKENATELLKLLNGYRSRAVCVDSSLDFKHLKNPSN